ncbi:Stk1 family PASTA domain-containing Ser/Thr kinase [Macrococcus lamae]|uniref:Serine/threonine-protein kinase PrkC n=1 Tax=Macrococcus lamae TaxID=198484 RepID=A0A4R6BT80_9STAP|nr:Stk1 family PASTA domain-containing Ser/Thr kinase [Macrococcus lamae]TDM07307.1 Stk1 family PASTA domain-containing Ser/Thr kinase [Macrococcus lamae]
MLGTIISERYKLIQYIGGGGMSNVYLAEDIILDRKAAVKIINIPPNDKERAVQRFEREVQNATTLSHPNIVKVIDVDEDDHHYYLIMEYIEGPTLSEYIRDNGPLPVDEAILFTKQILRGIGDAHHHMIIHRDIKPQNILLTENKEIKITDFGIARALSETAMTQTNHVMGSVHYLPPEQAKGKAADESADIYSIGIVLFEMLTGHPPFEGDSPVSIAIKHIQEPLPDILAGRSDVPQSLENVVIKATMKEKYSRYRTTEEMYDDLSTVLDIERQKEQRYQIADDKTMMIPVVDDNTKTVRPVTAAVTSVDKSQHSAPAAKKKNRFLMILLPLLLMLLIFGAILWYMFSPKYSDVPSVAGKTLSQTTAIFEKENLRKGKVVYEYSAEYDDGTVISSTPKSGTKVKEMTKVDLLVSKGVKKYGIKNYKGKKIDEVREMLEKAGFKKVSVKEVYNAEPEGTILTQSLNPGQQVVPSQSNITFNVSKGPQQIYVGDYTGQSFDNAKSELEAQGFVVNVVAENYNEDIKKGNIISQDAKNMKYTFGSTINFELSKGREPKKEQAEKPTTEEPSTEKPTTEEPEKPDKPDKKYTETVTIPYRKSEETSTEEGQAKETPKQTVEIYINDKNNSQDEVFESFELDEDVTKKIMMTIEPDAQATYIIKIDGVIYKKEVIDYDEI